MNRSTTEDDNALAMAKQALETGENFLAYDLASALPSGKFSLERIRIMALALARSGSPAKAAELASSLPDGDDPDIIGLKSRIIKDLAQASHCEQERKRLFRDAADKCLSIFDHKPNYYNGINAASCLLMSGDHAAAKQLVSQAVLRLCEDEKNRNIWLLATLGECHLILGNIALSAEFYKSAISTARKQKLIGNLSSMLKQLHMLNGAIPETVQPVLATLQLPSVAIFSGHTIDKPGLEPPRFPLALELRIRERISLSLSSSDVCETFSSCACGSDIILIEEAAQLGLSVNIVPPFPLEVTIRKCVSIAPGNWEERLRKTLSLPNVRLLPAESDEIGEESDDIAYDFTNREAFGLAVLKSRISYLPLIGISVWNGEISSANGCTATAVMRWRQHGIKHINIDPRAL